MLIENFNSTINVWIEIVQQYNFKLLCAKPGANSWSIGQVCMHLINDTNWFIEQIKICASSNSNANETMLPVAQTMFINNSFADERFANAANSNIPQPESKKQLLLLFLNLKKNMNEAAGQIEINTSKGKTKHPGLNYFNANEWLQFAEMHLRHHLKQKERIENFFKQI